MSKRLSLIWMNRRRLNGPGPWFPAFARMLFAMALYVIAMAACMPTKPNAVYDAEKSPALLSADVATYNEGSEGTQYVRITLAFDQAVAVSVDYLPELFLAGAKVDKNRIEVTGSAAGIKAGKVQILVRTDVARTGEILCRLAPEGDESVRGLTDESGAYAAGNRTIFALAPSGIALEPAGQGAVEVAHRFNIRVIAWIYLHDGGETVTGSLLAGADALDGAIALHGHDFLTDDEYDVAVALAETLTSHFGDRYAFEAAEKVVHARSLLNPDANLTMTLYAYVLIL